MEKRKWDGNQAVLYGQPGDHDLSHLDMLYVYYSENHNPLFVWDAIRYCLAKADEDHNWQPFPIPNWCLGYLNGVALDLHMIKMGAPVPAGTRSMKNGKSITVYKKLFDTPKEQLGVVLTALGLRKKGKNAFYDYEQQRMAIGALDYFHYLTSEKGLKATEAESVLAQEYGVEENTTVRRWVTRARKLMRNKKLLADRLRKT